MTTQESMPTGGPRLTPPRPRPSRWWLWALGAVLCALAVFATYAAFVDSTTGQLVEYRAFQAVEPVPGVEPAAGWTTTVLRYGPNISLGCAAAGLVWLLARGRWRPAVPVLVAFAGANLTTQVLKASLVRPFFDNGVPYVAGNSLPSGHTTLAATAAVALMLTAPVLLRPWAALAGALLTGLIAASAFLEAWHRPSDMVAATAVALGWGLLAAPFVQRWDPPVPPEHAHRVLGASAVEVLLWGVGLLAAGAALALLGAAALAFDSGAEPGALALAAGLFAATAPIPLAWAVLLTALRLELRWQRRRA